MSNPQTVRILWLVLGIEIAFALFCMVVRSFGSFIIIFLILGFLGAIAFVARYLGLWSVDFGAGSPIKRVNWNGRTPRNYEFEIGTNPNPPTDPNNPNQTGRTKMNPPNNNPGNWNFGNFSINLGNYPEQIEVMSQTLTLEEGVKNFAVNVLSGNLRVTGQENLAEIKLNATRRVWSKDTVSARLDLDRLQVRTWREGATLRVEAGDPTQGFVVGRAPRIDLELLVPAELAANFTTTTGDLICQQFHGELTARTTVGTLAVSDFNSEHNINLQSTGGRLSLQSVAAGNLRVKAGAGAIQLTGVGAEQIELEATAGSIRGRGINCGRYTARATTGSVDLYEAHIEFGLELKAGAGRVYADNITSGSFRLDATTGSIFYRGVAPAAASEVTSGVGNVQLFFATGAAFNLEAQSSVGGVELYLPVSAVTYQARNGFNGQIGGGGPPLKVVSQVGSIRVAQA